MFRFPRIASAWIRQRFNSLSQDNQDAVYFVLTVGSWVSFYFAAAIWGFDPGQVLLFVLAAPLLLLPVALVMFAFAIVIAILRRL